MSSHLYIQNPRRPDPKAKSRPLFNSLHKFFGNITHLLAVLTIFYAVPLSQARLPDYTTFVLVGFVSYYLLMHIILTVGHAEND